MKQKIRRIETYLGATISVDNGVHIWERDKNLMKKRSQKEMIENVVDLEKKTINKTPNQQKA